MPPGRKRKRLESPEPEQEEIQEDVVKDSEQQIKHDPEKEQDVWESLKDEHFEAYTANLLPTIQQYIRKRVQTLAVSHHANGHEPEEQSNPNDHEPSETNRDASPTRPMHSGLPSNFSKPITTSRETLSRIACLVDELLRASEEKVNVAQAAYDSQAIKDQEASITLGARPGHLEPGNLSELTVGRWVKPSRATLSPINGDELDEDMNGVQDGVTGDDPSEAFKGLQISTGKRGRGKAKGSRQKSADANAASTPPLTITLPAQPAPVEETFCVCHQGSFGEMIACDNKKCDTEWCLQKG
ncbi:hypothetical protein DXG01_006586 [Tephrocybe rancida]|nr:hypothetical protein DXG01_006586 [Tephrocybe rancida]